MRWSEPELQTLARGAFLHDIGKLGIPDAILLKAGALTPEERNVVQQYVRIGFNVVRNIAIVAGAAEIVLAHHEPYDGLGYPRGTKGRSIPLSARVFAVADTLDAMTSDRPYRKASSFDVARYTIRRHAGSHFDPNVVALFLKIPERTWSTIAANCADGEDCNPADGRKQPAERPGGFR
jgi:HD-GYP domain-containing protein (c-di-GMP phosphodiesterase class II)